MSASFVSGPPRATRAGIVLLKRRKVIAMYRKLILAGAMTAALTAPAFAEWNVLKPVPAPSTATDVCMIVQRTAAAAGEERIAGPFATEAQAKTAAAAAPACINQNADHNDAMKGAKAN
jgi:hypothetical protein